TRSSTADMGNIENEYIRNLQQQVYFLELEANYLYPLTIELSRRESKILMLEAEKDTAIKRMRDSEEEHAAEKRQLVNEIVSLKKLRDMSERDSTRKVLQAQQFKAEAEKGLTSLQDAERRIQNYRAELDRKSEDFNSLRIELEEKRAECLRLKTQLQEMDDRYFDSQAKTKEQLSRELRVQDDCTALIKENAALAAQVVELQKHIDMDRAHRDEKDVRRHANIQELISTKENEKQLKTELEKTRELLRLEQSALRDALDKLSREEQASLEANLRRTQLRNELSEVELLQDSTANENVSLNRDKLLLSDEVTSLRARLDEKDDELDSMRLRLEEAEARNAQLEGKVRMQRNLESIKWEEFEKLATTMKAFSRNMSPAKADLDYN
ncbi:predicted protein, partial [Nematostella vectensis]